MNTRNDSGVPILDHPIIPINYNIPNPPITVPSNTEIEIVNGSDQDFHLHDQGGGLYLSATAGNTGTFSFTADFYSSQTFDYGTESDYYLGASEGSLDVT